MDAHREYRLLELSPSQLKGRRGTGQIRGKVKEDENRIGIADARSLWVFMG